MGKRSDFLDFRDEVVFNKERKIKVDKSGYIDVSGLAENDVDSAQTLSSPVLASSGASSFSSFWDNVGSSAGTSTGSISSSPSLTDNSSNLDLQNLKVKIEDMEYKLDRFIEKIDLIESKMNEFERKVSG